MLKTCLDKQNEAEKLLKIKISNQHLAGFFRLIYKEAYGLPDSSESVICGFR